MKRPLDSRQLYAFATLARTGSFTRAGKRLYLSQSAVSHSIKALEEDVGCRLLDRVGKKIALTHAGEQLLHHAEKILKENNQARVALEQLARWGQHRLRVGASSTACEHILPTVLRGIKDKFPQCTISIEPGDTPEMMELLYVNRIDLALALKPDHAENLEFLPLFSDEMTFLTSPSHAWALARHVTRREIPRQNYILYSKTSYTFRLVEDYFRDEKMDLNTVIELGSMDAIKEMVKLGLGISIVAPWIAREDIARDVLVPLPLGPRKLKRHWGIFHRRGRQLNLMEETFIALCRTAVESLAP